MEDISNLEKICENCEHYVAYDDMIGVCEEDSLPVFPNEQRQCFILRESEEE